MSALAAVSIQETELDFGRYPANHAQTVVWDSLRLLTIDRLMNTT